MGNISLLSLGYLLLVGTTWPVSGCSLTCSPSRLPYLGRTEGLLHIIFAQLSVCSLFSDTSVSNALCSCSHQAAPCSTALVRSCSTASHDSWWHEEPIHLLFSLCQASLNNVLSCVHKNEALIDPPAAGPQALCHFLSSWGLYLHCCSHTLSPNSS